MQLTMDECDPSKLTLDIRVDLLRATAFHLHLHNWNCRLGFQGLYCNIYVGQTQPTVADRLREGREKAKMKRGLHESTDISRITSGTEKGELITPRR